MKITIKEDAVKTLILSANNISDYHIKGYIKNTLLYIIKRFMTYQDEEYSLTYKIEIEQDLKN